MVKIKICGVMDVKTALAASEAGADMLGLVFAPSSRRVTPQMAQTISNVLSGLPRCPELVGVFVNSPADEVNGIAALCRLDRVQLSGKEGWDYCRAIEHPIIKTLHVEPETDAVRLLANIEAGSAIALAKNLVYLLDTGAAGAYGGTGRSFDWRIIRDICKHFDVMVAGGLTPDNVADLLGQARAWGVDASSGLETGGKKDISKIRAFINAVRHTELDRGKNE